MDVTPPTCLNLMGVQIDPTIILGEDGFHISSLIVFQCHLMSLHEDGVTESALNS